MFERFTDRARRVLVLAQGEARQFNHNFINTEHILLGLIEERDGVAARALESLDVSLEAVRRELERNLGPSGPPRGNPGSPPFTPRAKRLLELALREALELRHNYIGTEHLLLGLVDEGEGVAAQTLEAIGVTLSQVRDAVLVLLEHYQRGRGDDEPNAAVVAIQRTPDDSDVSTRSPDLRRPKWLWVPEGVLGGIVPLNVVIADSDRIAVAINRFDCYPLGFMMHLVIHDHLGGQPNDAQVFHVRFAELIVELHFADGSTSTTQNRAPRNQEEIDALADTAEPPAPILRQGGRHGNSRMIDMAFWGAPLPPTGPLEIVVEWTERGLARTTASIDAELLRKAARQSRDF